MSGLLLFLISLQASAHAVMVLGVDDPISPPIMERLAQVQDLWDTRLVTW